MVELHRGIRVDGIFFILTERKHEIIHGGEPCGVAGGEITKGPIGSIHQASGTKGLTHSIKIRSDELAVLNRVCASMIVEAEVCAKA